MEQIIFSEEQQTAVCNIIKAYVEEFGIERVSIIMPGSWQHLGVELSHCSMRFSFHERETLVVAAEFNGDTVRKEFGSTALSK